MTSVNANRAFERLLDYLRLNRGFDFTGYKRSSLIRRVRCRMQNLGIESYTDYLDYLEVHPDEFTQLFNTILINVTGFFRDREAWNFLSAEIIPRILATKRPDEAVRAWSAGCASGEEPYTLAILLAEALGTDQCRQRVRIYATDVDEKALNQARQAVYTARQVEPIPRPLLEKYFERVNGRFQFQKELRRSVIFGRHNLVQDAPISRVDLLVCRNTLMYFNAETQAKILARFHFALNDQGFLFLSKAEMLLTRATLFVPVNLRYRVFEKVPNVNLRDRFSIVSMAGTEETVGQPTNQVRLRDAAFDTSPVAQVVIDTNGVVVLINQQARQLFNLTARDVGRLFQDLELSYRPRDLRAH